MADHLLPLCVTDNPLTPARDELARLNTELAAAVAEQEAVAAPLRRLEHVVAETDRLTGRLDEMRCDHDARIGEWIADGDPEAERPALAPEAVVVEDLPY